MTDEPKVPQDEFSRLMRELTANPGAVRRDSSVELTDFYGNVVTWRVTTFRCDATETVFLQRQTASGGERWVLPPEVTAAMGRQRDSAIGVVRKRGARTAAATREARGIEPGFLKGKKAKGKS